MVLRRWGKLPEFMCNESVRIYYDNLKHKKFQLIIKRLFDLILSIKGIIILSPLMLVIALLIKLSSKGSVFFKQKRITQYGRVFNIIKFRTMVENAENLGEAVTISGDKRITKIGLHLRKYRLDELPQLINVLKGDMSFVGVRPEAVEYISYYDDEMFASLLLPAGITSKASIQYKDEALILSEAVRNGIDIKDAYVNIVLPQKMKINLDSIRNFSLKEEIKIIFSTFGVLFGII